MQRIRYQAASILIGAERPFWVDQKATFNTIQLQVRFALSSKRPDEVGQKIWVLKKNPEWYGTVRARPRVDTGFSR